MRKRRIEKAPARSAPWTLSEAKARFSALVDEALCAKPQRVLRNGRDEVVVVRASVFDALTKPKRSLIELFSALRGVEIDLSRTENDSREIPKF